MLTMNSSDTRLSKLIFVTFLSGSLFAITACQKSDNTDESEAAQSNVKVTKITPPEGNDVVANDNGKEVTQEDVELTTLNSDMELDADADLMDSTDNRAAVDGSTVAEIEEYSSHIATNNNANKKIQAETQVTDVEYQDKNGQSIHVTFQTSAVDALEANLMLPSGKRVLLTAPTGQGNNPTYESKDGSIELVTHGGGGSIDLLYEGKSTSFEAVSADAEVLTPK